MSAKPLVICAGRLYADLVFTGLSDFPSPDKEVFADGLTIAPGGGAPITAAYLAALGHAVELATSIPVAPFGPILVDAIRTRGVGLSLSDDMPAVADPQVTVAIVHGGDRAFLTRRDGMAVPFDVADRLAASGARHLHIGELATLVEPPGLAAAARAAGMTVSLDCSWNEADFDQATGEVIASVDVFFPNAAEHEAFRALGLAAPLAPLTVVKRGANGAKAITLNGTVAVPAAPADVVDPTGAGDAFDAGFLSAWLGGADLADCLAFGNRLGAVALAHIGGMTGAEYLGRDARKGDTRGTAAPRRSALEATAPEANS